MKNYVLVLFIAVFGLSSCLKKDNTDPYADAKVQLAKDTTIIRKFITDNNIPAIKDASGIFYQIIEPGSGNVTYSTNTQIEAIYTGKLLNGTIFDTSVGKANLKIALGKVITGWQIGIPLIQKGGKIRLIIPSGYAYGNQIVGGIPANSILDFDIELVNVQ
ncbi:FKBP-type peptidyl-prolyl cis-trans isomerase [Pedobacter sp. SD-b]|uniref:Peptidyl-prolyl cis-trans isomerase n=1 Tax=Pedobacter segetis TaxID=2793069 RepID=A0ABS1BLG3_9SPHI|nr:FKBP-type peptidyl-prolyl cis-trans isomerase [Pedobacter segetis]MBK0383733.1 FKBP-type peptidyl-prolyl cis-trans isomerase [Pedobacter segetis]